MRFKAANWHILRAALYLASAALLLRVGGMVNQVIVSANFGAGATMDAYFEDAAKKTPQPEIHVNPNRLAKYDAVAKVLADAQRLGATHIGFTGIDQYN